MSKPSNEEINAVLDKCADAENEGTSQWAGMTYEQGVRAAIEWMLGNTPDSPVSDE